MLVSAGTVIEACVPVNPDKDNEQQPEDRHVESAHAAQEGQFANIVHCTRRPSLPFVNGFLTRFPEVLTFPHSLCKLMPSARLRCYSKQKAR